MAELYTVGKIVNTHGIKGELKVMPVTDFPEQRFAPGSQLVIEAKTPLTVTVAGARKQKAMYLLKLKEFDDINDVERFKGLALGVADADVQDLSEGEYYYHDIIGLTVIDQTGATLGQVSEILSPGANDVWVIPRPGKPDVLLPFLKSVVLRIDLDAKVAHVDVPEGLIDDAD
ncbi:MULTISPECIES: ribosome maturation factor RimM [unclassified Lacticaseibacillus]|uniref:ribosome maturation factor RimM n=1 Tax=unclassified Lacticaseibacillus TaxID=2759744 RepID=UPI001943074C|nr:MULTISPECIES: ribosome maturation factor RimM [unclassified Lacticaseibacillus]